ncbi:hypothetical protein TTHERM_00526530 (macronuclear) [Tetrahymena thermophila SB210]|uniref:Tetratricopeptide repeat protein n=1 Tax=Tetrahymena thermophila (strain SB210) TaxID=312017 RepID=I7M4Q0_TETTS|nr:hypothetical protein TTHERM_00526530 [Tetrahymena thermophila SB210]EAS07822.2 hypothetical protein TTHERM_00526530 [Tetrahymena thermophila SB210]|eukprot:XP_001028064.2 hypothetical protein TTHERM_00526530 [Tetrahymena thermophila SB210]
MSNIQQIIQKQFGQSTYTGREYQDKGKEAQHQQLITKKIYDRLQNKIKQNNIVYLSNYTNINSRQQQQQLHQQKQLQQNSVSCKKSNLIHQNEYYQGMPQQQQQTQTNSILKNANSIGNQSTQILKQSGQYNQQQILDQYNYTVQQSIQMLSKYDRQLKQKTNRNQNCNSTQTGQSFFSTKPCSARTNLHTRTQSLAAANNNINNNIQESNNNFSYCSPRIVKENNSIVSSARSLATPAMNIQKKEQTLIMHQEDLEKQSQLVLLAQSQTKLKGNIFKENSEQEQIKITPFLEERIFNEKPLSRASSAHSINLQNNLNREQQIRTHSQKTRISQQETRPQSSFSQNRSLIFNSSQIQTFNEQMYKKNNYVKEEEEHSNSQSGNQQNQEEKQTQLHSRNNLKSANLSRRSQNNLRNNNSQSFTTLNLEQDKKDINNTQQKPNQQLNVKSISLNSKLTLEEKQEQYKLKRKKQSDILPFLDYKGDQSLKYLHMYLYLNKNEILNMIYNFAEYSVQLEDAVWEIITKAVETTQLKILAKILIFVGEIEIAVGNLDKAAYFLNQARICCEMNKGSDYLKSQAYQLIGDICIYQTKYSESLLFYKKSLQYAWYCNARDQEIDLYDKLGIAYYYLQELKKSSVFHQRSMVADYEDIDSHLRRISYEVTHEIRKNQKEDQQQINYVIFAHLSLPLNLAQMDFYQSPKHANNGLISSNNYQLQNEQYRSDLGYKKEQKLLFTSLNKKSSANNTNVGLVNNDVTLISNTSMIIDSVNYKSQHHSHSSRRPSTSIKQTKQTPHYQQKQSFLDEEEYQYDTPRQKDEEEDWLQHEGTARMKKQLYDKATVDSIIENLLKENDFIFQMSTPKHSAKLENSQQQENSKFRIHREKYENSNLNKVNYDFKSFGVISNSQSQRKFDDITLYKFPLEKKIEILKSQNFDLNQVWHRINRAVASSQRFNQQLNDRIRVNQNTPNRCAANYKSFPKITFNKIKNIYEKLLNEFEVRNDNANQ